MMSHSAGFIILGSEYGLGLSASTCSMQMACGLAEPPVPCPLPPAKPAWSAVLAGSRWGENTVFCVPKDKSVISGKN